jgi:purine-nucleoside phosphorylase
LNAHNITYTEGKTWTTDAIYRETPEKIALRRSEGCIAVEMEAAAFFAVAQFRGAQMGQILYGGDDVGGETWDGRHWTRQTTVREKLFWLAAEACLSF